MTWFWLATVLSLPPGNPGRREVNPRAGKRSFWYSAQVNGYTSLALTRLDILDHFTTIKVCTAYTLDGERVNRFPSDANALKRCQPIWEEIKGWDNGTSGATCLEDLPEGARAYIKRIEELVGIPVDIISTGPKRHETILVRNVY